MFLLPDYKFLSKNAFWRKVIPSKRFVNSSFYTHSIRAIAFRGFYSASLLLENYKNPAYGFDPTTFLTTPSEILIEGVKNLERRLLELGKIKLSN